MVFSYVDVLFSKHITLLLRSSMILFFACVANLKDSGQDPIDISIIDTTRSLSKVANWITDSKGYATGFATTDIDQDGFVDVVLSYGNDMDKGPIEIYINEEGVLPTSPNWTSYTTGFYGHISTGDINGDEYPDIGLQNDYHK